MTAPDMPSAARGFDLPCLRQFAVFRGQHGERLLAVLALGSIQANKRLRAVSVKLTHHNRVCLTSCYGKTAETEVCRRFPDFLEASVGDFRRDDAIVTGAAEIGPVSRSCVRVCNCGGE